MGEASEPQLPDEEPAYRPTFRFAGVELKPDDDPQEISREVILKRIRVELWVNSIGSVLAGTVLLLIERWLGTVGFSLYPLPPGYPNLSHGLLRLILFYIGWAMYWGIRDVAHATTLDEHHPLNNFMSGVLGIFPWLGGALLRIIVIGIVLIVYNLLGGGFYAVYKLVRQGRIDLAEVGPN